MRITLSRRIQLVALFIWCTALLVSPFWWAARVKERREIKDLYFAGVGGDVSSVQRLAERGSPDSTALLERLAKAPHAFAESRVAAIRALGAKRFLDSEALTPLLWIDQPFIIRHATVEVFERRGCDASCVSATLYSLHAIHQGQLTAETRLARQNPDKTTSTDQALPELSNETNQDYLTLLTSNPCTARKLLAAEYSSDSSFADNIRSKLQLCQAG